jgi:hypothetical protein
MQRAAGPYYAITERQVADSDSTLETAAASDAARRPSPPQDRGHARDSPSRSIYTARRPAARNRSSRRRRQKFSRKLRKVSQSGESIPTVYDVTPRRSLSLAETRNGVNHGGAA